MKSQSQQKPKKRRDEIARANPRMPVVKVHPKAAQIEAAERRVNEHGSFFDFDVLLRLEQAALGASDAFYEALVMMRRKMG